MARLEDQNRVRREHDELCSRLGLKVRPAVAFEEASAVGRPAVSSSAVLLRGDLERADASSNAAEPGKDAA